MQTRCLATTPQCLADISTLSRIDSLLFIKYFIDKKAGLEICSKFSDGRGHIVSLYCSLAHLLSQL